MSYDFSQAYNIIAQAVLQYKPTHIFGLFSGGHDSVCATHIASQHPNFTGAAHINTGIGIEETRKFVRNTCEEQNWPFYEYCAPEGKYDNLVLQRGFPHGPQSHNTMLFYLKQKQISRLVKDHKRHRYSKILLVTGIRQNESDRRFGSSISQEVRRNGAFVWANPILYWSKQDCSEYMRENNIRRNEVSDHLHRSGECLCGALANHKEIHEIEYFYPKAAERIRNLERQAEEKGLVDCRWAQKSRAPNKTWDDVDPEKVRQMPLCTGCESRYEE